MSEISDEIKSAYFDGYDNDYNAGFEAGQRDVMLEKTQLPSEDTTSDLISRRAAIDVTDAIWCVTGDKNVAKVWDQIKDLPSAQPEVIRCKDCKYYQFADNRAFGMPVKMCKWFGFEDVDDDDFCSRAERR